MKFKFTKKQIKTLEHICLAFIPTIVKGGDNDGYWERKGTDLPVVEEIEKIIASLPIENQKSFLDLLKILDSKLLGLTWWGALKSIQNLNDIQKQKLLNRWAKSPIPLLRGAYNALKKLVGIVYFGYSEKEKENPNWKTISYPGPLENIYKNQIPKLSTEKVFKDTTIQCDVVVIGSGAGGGVVAAELAKAGQEVIILEKGDYIDESKMSYREVDMISSTYDRKGAFTSEDASVAILAGSCLGGGTTINWSASFRTPNYILEEWAKEHDNPQFLNPDYKKCFEFIEKRTHINTKLSQHNSQNQSLWNGAKKLGYHVDLIPRNVHPNHWGMEQELYWKSQGYGGLGDSFGHKQGTLKTFLEDAVGNGAKIYVNTRAQKVQHQQGKVTGVLAEQISSKGERFQVNIQCKKVVVSAGAIHTPVILKKSGLEHPQIGRNLYLHPVNAVGGIYPHQVESWYGPMMSAVSDQFANLDGNFGYKIETPPIHSGFAALSTPWKNGEQYKNDMLDISRLGVFLVLTRDKYGGQVKVSQEGRPLVHYKLHPYDRKHLIHGMKECAKIHAAAGAKKIRLLHNEYYEWNTEKGNIDDFVQKIDTINWKSNRFILYSAHQMGTCRMGGRAKDHPLLPTGETREIKNLFVADASAFPRCSGVNPMLSIQALSYYISQHII